MTKLQEYMEYQRKQCENERMKYGNNNRDAIAKQAENNSKHNSSNVKRKI